MSENSSISPQRKKKSNFSMATPDDCRAKTRGSPPQIGLLSVPFRYEY